jgi:2-oxoglutarate ferredoxin oxidoreductase subunit alpha
MASSGLDRTNDFAFKIGTVNGTGSASANGLLMQSIFRMGIPVSGKNIFPSNIQGLPTWYEVRVNRDGHITRTPRFDLMVTLNPNSVEQDIAEVVPGGYVVHDSSWPLDESLRREDVTFLGVPMGQMCVEAFEGARPRILMKNILYVGILTALLDIDTEIVKELLREKFERKPKLLDLNYLAVKMGYDYAKEHFESPLPLKLEAMDETGDCVLMDGNTAAALGCLYAGATVAAWYPITPATSLMDRFLAFCEGYRKDPETGKNLYCIIQAEDELAAVGMVLGASWMGARAFTPTSGPGISLMSEFIGLAYYAEIPAVIFDVQRTGPSTGMPTRTQQCDLLLCAYASHGDTKHLLLFPADPSECFEMAVQAFDLADRFQTAVFVLSDLDIAMNDWACPRMEWDDAYEHDRGRILSSDQIDALDAFYRYLDVDEQEVATRTLPGVNPKGAYFTRGSGHTKFGRYTEDSAEYVEVVDRIARKIASAADSLPEPIVVSRPDAEIGIVAVGSSDGAVREAIDRLAEQGVQADYMRIRAFPFHKSVDRFLEDHDRVFVVEQNRDAQLRSLLTLETNVAQERLVPVRYYGGLSLSADHVLDGILPHLGESGALPKGTAERPATTNGDDAGNTGAAKPKVGAS